MTILPDTRAGRKRTSLVGGNNGIVLDMDMVWTSYDSVAYTVPVQVGINQQNLSLQVDTGSSDLWIASTSCSSASCSATNGRLYDPSSAQSTGTTLTMQYLAGSVSGPIVWDQVDVGGYIIPNQALAAATAVNNEPLSYNFDGILGLALPLNSLIQQIIPASTSNAPDGAAFSSNLFSLTPNSDAPSQPFFSLTLARPGSSQVPSLLGIGAHPPEIVSDPSQIRYSSLVGDSIGTLFWKTTVGAITVYVNGQARPVALQSLSGTSPPTALLDSGVPLIITTPALANGIYGALGIGPASDGNYYVPCATPLNMTITLDGQNELPLHPLDLTTEPAGQSSSQYCTGLIQTDPSQLTANSDVGDMILGVPFMRNVYTVMAYQQPNASGNFNNSVLLGTDPTLGLLGLTNATRAMEEFNQVRVLNQPLGGSSQQDTSSQDDSPALSIGVKILIGLVGFFVLCLALCALRSLFARRRWRQNSPIAREEDESDPKFDRSSLLYDSLPHKTEPPAYTVDSRPYAEDDDVAEVGMWKSKLGDTCVEPDASASWTPQTGSWRDTCIFGADGGEVTSSHTFYFPSQDDSAERTPDSPDSPGVTSALLVAHGSDSQASDLAAFGMGMAGVGTAARGSVIDTRFQHGWPSLDGARSMPSSPRSSHTLVESTHASGARSPSPSSDID